MLLAFRPRTLTRLLAAAQLALPVALGVSEAIAAGTGGGPPAHVEETSGKHCQPAHVDDCIVCRHLSTSAVKSSGAPVIPAAPILAQPASTSEINRRPISRRGLQSRAPPDLLS